MRRGAPVASLNPDERLLVSALLSTVGLRLDPDADDESIVATWNQLPGLPPLAAVRKASTRLDRDARVVLGRARSARIGERQLLDRLFPVPTARPGPGGSDGSAS